MMGAHPHNPMAVSIAGKELREALVTILTPEITRKGISTLDIQMFISIIIMFLKMNVEHGIKKNVPFVDYVDIHFLSIGKEW